MELRVRYLITGGAGFMGSHLAEALLGRGDRVTVIDDLSTGSMSNIAHLKQHPRFTYVIDTMMNAPLLAELVDEADQLFHFAAAVGVMLVVESPVRTIETNIGSTELVLAATCKKHKKVLIASTSEVYGKSSDVPFREDGDLVLGQTTRGRWSYACSKALDEFLAIAYWRERRCPTLVARFFNTVGPRQTGRYGMVVPRFVTQALQGDPITVHGDGTQRRCFGSVHDVVPAMTALLDTPEAYGTAVNLGGQQETSILGLAERIRELTGSAAGIRLVPYQEAYGPGFEDMRRRMPDLTLAGRLIGYRPQYRLNDIIKTVI